MSGYPRWARWGSFATRQIFPIRLRFQGSYRTYTTERITDDLRRRQRKAHVVQRLLPNTVIRLVVIVQVTCAIHFVATNVCEVRVTSGPSMLPTLAMSGDYLLHCGLPFLSALRSMRCALMPGSADCPPSQGYVGGSRFSKYDQAQGTGLKQGDLVVAISPLNPHLSVCKRVLGLPGDTVCLDPRLPPIPASAWRAAHIQPTPVTNDKKPAAPASGAELLNNSMDHISPNDTQTRSHNHAAQLHTEAKGQAQYITVPVGHVWLAGDNMANSTDSRHYGPVPLGLVRGKVIARVWPDWQWHTISHP